MSEEIKIPYEKFSSWTAILTTISLLVTDPMLPIVLNEMLEYERDLNE